MLLKQVVANAFSTSGGQCFPELAFFHHESDSPRTPLVLKALATTCFKSIAQLLVLEAAGIYLF